ncbi:hypothetical protein FXO38_11104 [Capsicum annuum]|nr:hypothetical protein FXO38_11104 [Capsicum annuum]KAF3684372.1 hypothetical protein FXO37_01374 [Capsicum annuum]
MVEKECNKQRGGKKMRFLFIHLIDLVGVDVGGCGIDGDRGEIIIGDEYCGVDESEGEIAITMDTVKHEKVNLLPNQLRSDARISSFRLEVSSPELESSLEIKERLEASVTLKKLFLMLIFRGTSIVIADGDVKPAMSGILANSTKFFDLRSG